MKRFPSWDEIESIRKEIEVGFDLEDWEICVYREFMRGEMYE